MAEMFSIFDMSSKDLSFVQNADLRLVSTDEDVETLLSFIAANDRFGFDIETSGLSFLYDKIVGFSIANSETSFYCPFGHKFGQNIHHDFGETILKALIGKKLIYHNAKFDWKFIFHLFGIDLAITDDTFIMMALIDSDRIESKGKLALKPLIKEFFNIELLELKEDFGTTDFSTIPVEEAYYYAACDPMVTYMLWEKLHPQIESLSLTRPYNLEMGIIKYVARLEFIGIKIDIPFIKANDKELLAIVHDLKKEISLYGNNQFDIDSPAQLSKMLFEHLNIPKWKDSTSTDVRNLSIISDKHEVIPKLIEYSSLKKLQNAFCAKISDSVAEDGRLHSEFNQMGTRSGRFSSSGGFGRNGIEISMNMQQIPRSERFNIRKAFIPEEGYYWLHADYSQLEYRVMASLSDEDSLIDAYKKGVDFHAQTASILLGIPLDNVTHDQRSQGKTLNFAISYGMSKYGLAQKLGIQVQKAESFLNDYFAKVPKLKKLIRTTKENTLKSGFVRTHFGRIRWYRDLSQDKEILVNELRSTFNNYIQGTAAELAKAGLRRTFKAVDESGLDMKCVLTVHDELNFEINKSIPPVQAALLIKQAMEMTFPKSNVRWTPFTVEVSIGDNFGELYDLSKEIYEKNASASYEELMIDFTKDKKEEPKKDEKKLFTIIKPSILLSGTISSDIVSKLRELITKNFGLYRIYIRLEDEKHILLNEEYRINPTPIVLNAIQTLGLETEVFFDKTEKVDIDKLLA